MLVYELIKSFVGGTSEILFRRTTDGIEVWIRGHSRRAMIKKLSAQDLGVSPTLTMAEEAAATEDALADAVRDLTAISLSQD